MILHTLNAGPDSAAFNDCLRISGATDTILLMGSGVYCGLENSRACLALLQSGAQMCVLETDAKAAGILGGLSAKIQLVDFDGFVALSERCPRQLAWY